MIALVFETHRELDKEALRLITESGFTYDARRSQRDHWVYLHKGHAAIMLTTIEWCVRAMHDIADAHVTRCNHSADTTTTTTAN